MPGCNTLSVETGTEGMTFGLGASAPCAVMLAPRVTNDDLIPDGDGVNLPLNSEDGVAVRGSELLYPVLDALLEVLVDELLECIEDLP
jgi:hypothetical protein